MKKITTLIMTLTTLTVIGATVFYLGTVEKQKEKFEPSETKNAIVQKVSVAEPSKVEQQTDTTKTSKEIEKTDCFTYECAYTEYLDMLEGRKTLDLVGGVRRSSDWFGTRQNVANPMQINKNGQTTGTEFQTGTTR